MFKRLISGSGKPPPAPSAAELQDEVVRAVVADTTDLHDGEWGARAWHHIAVNHEVLIEEGRRSSTQALVLAREPGGELEALSFRLSMRSKQAMLALREAMAAGGKTPWTILDLTIERGGHYAFAFGHGPPPRLNGDLLYSPLKGLLERYLADRSER